MRIIDLAIVWQHTIKNFKKQKTKKLKINVKI